MPSNVYCPFCGIILLPDRYNDDSVSPQAPVRPWYAEVRGIYSTNPTIGNISITGVGILHTRNDLHAPLNSSLSYVDMGAEELQEWPICEPSESPWCFGFHESCWKLLLLRLRNGLDNDQHETAIAESVFYQLYCTPCIDASWFQFGHDYGGAAQTHKPFGRPEAVDRGSHLYADPLAIPSLGTLEETPVGGAAASDICRPLKPFPSPDRTGTETCQHPERSKHNILNGLSTELKFEIFSYLSFKELQDLRLVCRELSFLVAVDTLPQSYWRSRFLLDQEADFLFPSLTDTRNWSRLFFGSRTCLKAGLMPLVNRKRIRKLLEPIATLVEQDALFQRGPSGSLCHPVQSHDSYFQLVNVKGDEKQPQFVEISSHFSGLLASIDMDSPLIEGCRVLYHETQSLMPPAQQHQRRIGISTVQIGTQSFVTGVNLFSSEMFNTSSHLLGYRNPVSERWIDIPPTSHVKSLCVAFCSQGLTAIKFLFANSDSSGWVGNSTGPGIAQGTLSILDKTNQCCLFAGLDRFKIVSLGLGKLTDDLGASQKFLPQGSMRLPSVQSRLWRPHPPRHEELKFSTLLPSEPSQAFEPLTNIDFGGPRGLLLGSLAGLVFHMTTCPRPLIGIEVFYSDGRCDLFGSSGGCGITFFINGSKGERINRIRTLEDNRAYYPEVGLGGLEVSTNYGRTGTFAPLHYRLEASSELIPISSPGNTITGFVATEQPNQGRFNRFGIQSQQCNEPSVTQDILKRECHWTPDDQIRYDQKFSYFINSSTRGNYQTYASLRHVRKIRASTGIQDRSRSSDRISGLKIEYHNHPSPGIVGQWMKELDDGFELSVDEEVQSITICLVPMGFSTESPGMEVGQVAAICIETTHSRSVTFRSPDSHSLPYRMLRDQYQGNSEEKVMAISWILNASSEHVRAVVSGNESREAHILVPERYPPFDQVQKIYFETPIGNGCISGMATAEAYIQHQAIIGLVFVYTSGAKASIGDVNTGIRQSIHFPQNICIVGFSAAGIEHSITEIEFEVEGNEHAVSQQLRLSVPLTDAPVGSAMDSWPHVWCRNGTSAASFPPHTLRDAAYEPPGESRLVGLCVGCQDFSAVGALYEPLYNP